MGKLREKMAGTPSRARSGKGGKKGRISCFVGDCVYEANEKAAPATVTKLPTTIPRVTKVLVPERKTLQNKPTASPAFRRISHEVRAAEKADSQATSSSPPTASKPNPTTKAVPSASKPDPTPKAAEPRATRAIKSASKTKITTSPPKTFTPQPPRAANHVAIPKRPRGRPRKDAALSIPVEPAPISLGKRKPSIGSQPYREPTPVSSRAAKKQKVDDGKAGVVEKTVVKKTVVEKKGVKREKVVKRAVVEKKESKATKTGKLAKKGSGAGKKEVKEVNFKEIVTAGRGTTRSGKGYTI